MNLFQRIDVYSEIDNGMCIYRCFKKLDDGKFYMQNTVSVLKDSFNVKIDILQSERDVLELFVDIPINERMPGFDSIEEAIKAFERDFGK